MFPGEDIERLIPEKVRSILVDLRKTPIEHSKWLYGNSQKEIYQGDVLSNAVVYRLNDLGEISPRQGPAIVISNTCDCQPNQSESLLVAPVFPFEALMPDEDFTAQDIADFKRDLRRNHLKDQVFLPAIGSLPDSWFDFSQIFSISSIYFHSSEFKDSRRRIVSLSQKGHYFFLMRLSFFLGRPDPSDSKRIGGSREEEIRRRAYEIYLERGRRDGFALDDWLQAEKEIGPRGQR